MSKNIKNAIKLISDVVSTGTGISPFFKFNDVFYFKKLIAGSNISITENTAQTEITISSGNNTDNIHKFLLEGTSNNGEILHLSSIVPLIIKCTGYTDIYLDFNSIVDTDNIFLGVHVIENDFIISGSKSNLSVALNNTKQFSYLFEIISKAPLTKTSTHTFTIIS